MDKQERINLIGSNCESYISIVDQFIITNQLMIDRRLISEIEEQLRIRYLKEQVKNKNLHYLFDDIETLQVKEDYKDEWEVEKMEINFELSRYSRDGNKLKQILLDKQNNIISVLNENEELNNIIFNPTEENILTFDKKKINKNSEYKEVNKETTNQIISLIHNLKSLFHQNGIPCPPLSITTDTIHVRDYNVSTLQWWYDRSDPTRIKVLDFLELLKYDDDIYQRKRIRINEFIQKYNIEMN